MNRTVLVTPVAYPKVYKALVMLDMDRDDHGWQAGCVEKLCGPRDAYTLPQGFLGLLNRAERELETANLNELEFRTFVNGDVAKADWLVAAAKLTNADRLLNLHLDGWKRK